MQRSKHGGKLKTDNRCRGTPVDEPRRRQVLQSHQHRLNPCQTSDEHISAPGVGATPF